ncbi:MULTISPECIES: adenosylcobinamide-phosphate synthase CbiB [Paenibacillus]|uniref:Cobalamin biosynthesis protein CobD n=1 Tax=Paenibacillus odorifer TaxID=189426 RepID=A0A1R0WZN2_9BACL|nr:MULTISPECIES: adenosylcobinamide-phosphate synthase CbiB [Paenibacillus]ETT60302.1 cobalamin biosynthesis protein cobd [Paenibacillus sp. FSL H8-237]OMD18446.1 cobalamin biosynthesis protein CobD [Paenibacillus odorifer]OMD25303.1 cobalamin biosynthesis protein CobD [Paenibacillus odorifer]OME49353.1 cobalamin biosynthesis protein CobD [Paenibacillus odorifer]OME52507.1 cobalamin biosynthesis protein CobD [Paenibacillus odorifer]
MTIALVLLAAYVIDRIVGDPRNLPHPVIGMGKAITALERAIRRLWSRPQSLRRAGVLLPLCVAGGAWALTAILLWLLSYISPWLVWIAEVWLISTTIASKGLKDAGMAVYVELQKGDLPAARKALGMIVGRDTTSLDAPEIVRGTVETVAENIVDAIISPLFYALIGGAPLAMAYRAVNTLDSMVGYKNDKYRDLGWASARLDDVANFIPARITALLLALCAGMLRLDWRSCLQMVKRDAHLHPSPNSGYPESAVAGALGIRLGGENVYHGVASFRAYMGDPVRTMEPNDIIQTSRMMMLCSSIFVGLCAVAAWIWIGG